MSASPPNPAGEPSPLYRLLTSSGTILGVRGGGLVLQLLVFLLITRLLPIETVGYYAMINAGWLMARFLGPLALDQASMRFLSVFMERGQGDLATGMEQWSFRVVLGCAGVVGLLIAGVGAVAIEMGLLEVPMAVVAVVAVVVPIYAFMGLLVGQLRARQFAFWAQFPESALLPLVMGIGVSAIAATATLDLFTLLVAQAASVVVATGVCLLVRRPHRASVVGRFPPAERRRVREMAGPTWLSLAVNDLASRLLVFIAGGVVGPAGGALIEAAQRFGGLPSLVTWAMGISVSPTLSLEFDKKNLRRCGEIVSLGSWIAFLPGLAFLVVLIFIGKPMLVWLVGPGYGDAYWPMVLICAAIVVNASAGLASNAMLITGHERTVFWFSAAKLAIVAVGGLTFGMAFGAVGIAAAFLVGWVVRDIGLTILLDRRLGIRGGVWSIQGLADCRQAIRELRNR